MLFFILIFVKILTLWKVSKEQLEDKEASMPASKRLDELKADLTPGTVFSVEDEEYVFLEADDKGVKGKHILPTPASATELLGSDGVVLEGNVTEFPWKDKRMFTIEGYKLLMK